MVTPGGRLPDSSVQLKLLAPQALMDRCHGALSGISPRDEVSMPMVDGDGVAINRFRLRVNVLPAASVTFTWKVKLLVSGGGPVICPVAGLRVSPLGSLPDTMARLPYGSFPPQVK